MEIDRVEQELDTLTHFLQQALGLPEDSARGVAEGYYMEALRLPWVKEPIRHAAQAARRDLDQLTNQVPHDRVYPSARRPKRLKDRRKRKRGK